MSWSKSKFFPCRYFQSLVSRAYLSFPSRRFCNYHSTLISESNQPSSLRDMWILQCDISVQLFGMMMGVVRSASDLARQHRNKEYKPLRRRRNGMYAGGQEEDLDLELAFHGGARGGFQ